jgi:DNA repair protein RecO (recombination protein O)
MNIFRVPGIVLHTLPFKENDIIFSIFSPEGIIKLYAKGGASQKRGLKPLLTPLTCAEFVYKEGRSELLQCLEGSPIQHYLHLRSNLRSLEAACHMLTTIQKSQLPGKPAPHLYHLLVYSLEKIPDVEDPWTLAISFQMKVMRHDGLWSFEESGFPGLSAEENKLVSTLATTRSFEELRTFQTTSELKNKTQSFFERVLNNSL